jgi:hypothetical protein
MTITLYWSAHDHVTISAGSPASAAFFGDVGLMQMGGRAAMTNFAHFSRLDPVGRAASR